MHQKAAAVAALQLGVQPARVLADRANVHEKTIYNWRDQYADNPEFQALLQQKRQQMALKVYQAADAYVDQIAGLVETADLNNKGATAMGILLDKALAFSGQPSQITEHRHLHVHLAQDALAALASYLEAGYTAQEARQCLQQDDPDLFRALPAIEAEWEEIEEGEDGEPGQAAPDSEPAGGPIPEPVSID